MERSLSIDICAVDIDFIVMEQSDHVVDVSVGDGVEENIAAHFFHLTNHIFFFESKNQKLI